MFRALRRLGPLALALTLTATTATPSHAATVVGGPFLGLSGYYDYSDSGIRDDTTGLETHWWCGDTPSRLGDQILQQQWRISGGAVTVPEHMVLAEGPAGAWDAAATCNPSVIEGAFTDPFGDGQDYTYVMYYVGTANPGGHDNSIGAAFSNDGSTWRKYPTPVLQFTDTGHGYYGYAQPNATLVGGRVQLLFEQSDTGATTHWYALANSDGVTFASPAPITAAGLPSPVPSWGGAAFDPLDGRWYATYNQPDRPSSTTGGVAENGQPGVTLYATSSLDTGTWTELDTLDTVMTGSESNFIAGLLRNPDGTLATAFLPGVQVDLSQSLPRPAYNASGAQLGNSGQFNQWQITWNRWNPGAPLRKLLRVAHLSTAQHETTTGWYDSSYYTLETSKNLGSLYEAPTGTATVALYSCKLGATDYFVVPNSCLGQYKLGLEGYAYATAAADRLPLYRCEIPNIGDFLSTDPNCENQQVMGLIGYSQN